MSKLNYSCSFTSFPICSIISSTMFFVSFTQYATHSIQSVDCCSKFSFCIPKQRDFIILFNFPNRNDTFSSTSTYIKRSIFSSISNPPSFLNVREVYRCGNIKSIHFFYVVLSYYRIGEYTLFWGVGMYILFSCPYFCHTLFSLIIEMKRMVAK